MTPFKISERAAFVLVSTVSLILLTEWAKRLDYQDAQIDE